LNAAAQPLAVVRREAEQAPPALDFAIGFANQPRFWLSRPDCRGQMRFAFARTAVKDFDPLRLAQVYQQNGAAAISVLTDERYFKGHLDYLRSIAALQPRCPCCARILSAIPTRCTRPAPPGLMLFC
jgi:indole-3-glycerol phosphate synthase